MKLVKLALIGLFAAFFVAACSKTNPPTGTVSELKPSASTPKNDEWAGVRKLYTDTCSNCHKADGAGGSVTFSEGDPPLKVPTFKSERQTSEPDAEYIEQIKEGGDGMPSFKKRLNDSQIAQLVAYIRKEFQGKDVKLPAAANDKPAATAPNTTASAAPQEKGGKMEKEGEHEKGEKKEK